MAKRRRRISKHKRRRQIRMFLRGALVAGIGLLILAAIIALGCFIFSHVLVLQGLPESDIVQVQYQEEFTLPEVTALYKGRIFSGKGTTVETTVTGEVDTSVLGEYQVTWSADYKKKHVEKTIKYVVIDSEAPVIELNGGSEVIISPGKTYEEQGFTATDNYDGDMTELVTSEVSADQIVYTVIDSHGNEGRVVRTITYQDVVAPVITLLGSDTATVTQGNTYTDAGATAEDDVDGDISSLITTDGTVDTDTVGDYTITYTVTDAAGNTATAERAVTVVKPPETTAAETGKNIVYLTFDDGPCIYTESLLDVLDKYGVKATFFVTAQQQAYLNMIAEEASRGHTIAIHSYTHEFDIYQSEATYFDDLNKMKQVIIDQTGITPTIIRFPGGSSNKVSANYCVGIMTDLVAAVTAQGYQYCDWNVDSNDAGGATTADEVYENVIAGLKKYNVSVVLQHDLKPFSIEAVSRIIEWGLANGYTFLPMTSSSTMIHHALNN